MLVMGVDGSQEAEGRDRYNTTLPGLQQSFISQVLALKKPTVLVLVNGGAMSLGPLKNDAPAIVEAFYGGKMASRAIADVLFGACVLSGVEAQQVSTTPLESWQLQCIHRSSWIRFR